MLKIIFWIIVFFLSISGAQAQNQDDIWIFGESAQLDFSSGNPVASTGNAMSAGEGCASVTNQSGQLLFYTNGITVWNSSHLPMANGTGLMGHNSSTNSALIIPKPNSSSIYYVFTTGAADNSFLGGLRYSVVDMCLNGGLGGVTTKNVLLANTMSEKLAAIDHATNGSIWLLAHKMYSNEFYSYQISGTGVSAVPVITPIGVTFSVADDARGEMKASPSGEKIAMPIRSTRTVHLFDFNQATGVVSNAISWNVVEGGLLYGVEFSPDQTKLYTTRYGFGAYLHQFNLLAGTALAIGASGVVVGNSDSPHMAGMKLGPDGKIYVTRQEFYGAGGGASNGGAAHLAVINAPNTLGTGCNFVDDGLFLAGGRSRFGLPPKVIVNNSTPATATITASAGCAGNAINFSLTINNQSPTTVSWNFGDPGSGTNNNSNNLSPSHTYNSAGNYTVTATYEFECSTASITQVVIIPPAAQAVNLGNNTFICQGASITLTAGAITGPFLWSNGSTTSSISVAAPGTYWLQAGTAPCLSTDSVVIGLAPQPTVNLGPDIAICQGAQATLSVSPIGGNSYTWNSGATGPTLAVSTAGTYSLTVSNGFCSTTDQIMVSVLPAPTASLGNDMVLCPGSSLNLSAGSSTSPYLWSNGATTPVITVSAPGIYWLNAGTAPCQLRDSIIVSAGQLPIVDLGPDITICEGQQATLSVIQSPGNTYTWNTGADSPAITVTNPGTYLLTVNNGTCSITDAITVAVSPYPVVSLGPDLVHCQGSVLSLSATGTTGPYSWSTGATTASIFVSGPGTYWVEVGSAPCLTRDSIQVSAAPLPVVNLGPDQALCPNGSSTLFPNSGPGNSYLWSNGTTSDSLTVTSPGVYWVTVHNGVCSSTDSVTINIVQLPTPLLGNDTTICSGYTLNISANQFQGATYLWNTGSTNSAISVTSPGNYWVEVSVSNCSVADTISLTTVPAPVVNLGPDTNLCTQTSLQLAVNHLTGQSYLWNTGQTTPTIEVNNTGAYWLVASNGICQSADSVFVNFLSQFSLGADSVLCEGQTLILQAFQPGDITYSWSNGSSVSSIEVSVAGNYWVQINSPDCQLIDSVTIGIQPLPAVSLGNDTTVCAGVTVTLNSNQPEGAELLWSTGSEATEVTVSESGQYWLQVIINSCKNSDSLQVFAQQLPTFDLGNDTTICDGETFALAVPNTPGQTYLWSTGATSPIVFASSQDLYMLEVTENGCKATDSVQVFTEDCTFFVPNVFTPNSDNSNDYFVVNGMRAETWELKIFNRHGKLIFSTPDYKNDWNGGSVSDGVYYYHLFNQKSNKSYKGYVTILR